MAVMAATARSVAFDGSAPWRGDGQPAFASRLREACLKPSLSKQMMNRKEPSMFGTRLETLCADAVVTSFKSFFVTQLIARSDVLNA